MLYWGLSEKLYSRSLLFIAKVISENYLNHKRVLVMQERTKEIFSRELKTEAGTFIPFFKSEHHSLFHHLFILSKHLLSATQISTLTSAALLYQFMLYTCHNFNTHFPVVPSHFGGFLSYTLTQQTHYTLCHLFSDGSRNVGNN